MYSSISPDDWIIDTSYYSPVYNYAKNTKINREFSLCLFDYWRIRLQQIFHCSPKDKITTEQAFKELSAQLQKDLQSYQDKHREETISALNNIKSAQEQQQNILDEYKAQIEDISANPYNGI